jgi:hypothetical protein
MKLSWEEASSMLRKYISEHSPILGILAFMSRPVGTGASAKVVGRVGIRDANGVWVVVTSDDDSASILFPVALSLFEFGDSRALGPELQESSASKFTSFLSIINPPSRMVLHLFELNEPST